ncbi:MAG TPA: AsmA-like C-terminal domain-containing protein [Burkholderiales bacterium]|nr:AsmA-like C-terminal domain-containing protein [Burkholderiales bacterium]
MGQRPAFRARVPRRLLLWSTGLLAVLLVLGLAALLAAPLWLNADAVKQRLLAQVQRSLPGELGYQELEPQFFPRPGLTLHGPTWGMPGRVEARAAHVELQIAWLPLLLGDVRIGAVRLDAPRVVLFLPHGQGEGEPLTPAIIDARLRAALDRLAATAPRMELRIAEGELDLRPAQGAPLVLRHLEARLASRPDRSELEVSATSEPVQRLSGKIRLAREGLEGRVELELGGVDVAALRSHLPAQADAVGLEGKLDARLRGTMRGASQWSVDVDASAPRLQSTVAGKPLGVQGAALKATAAYAPGGLNVTLDSLTSAAPALACSGAFSAGDEGYAWRLRADRLALEEWWPVAAALAPQLSEKIRAHAVPRAGVVSVLEGSARADSLQGLWRAERLRADVTFEQVALDLPRFDLPLRELAGKARYADGVLRVAPLQGAIGASRIRDADVSVVLTGAEQALQGRLAVMLRLEEALRVARAAARAGPARRELARVQRLQGQVLAQLELNGALRAPRVAVSLSQLDFTAEHDALPHALALSAGTARYDSGVLSVRGLAGRLGDSTFSALTGTLELRAPYRLRLSDGRGDLALTGLERWLARRPAVARRLEGYQLQAGRAAVSVVSIEGPLAEPGRMRYRATLVPNQVVIRVRELEDSVRLHGGALHLEPDALSIEAVGASALGSALRLGGHMERIERGYRLRRLEASGTVGQPLLDWAQARYDAPVQARPVAPLQLDRVRVELSRQGVWTAQGAVQSQDGARLEFDLQRQVDGPVELSRLALREAQSDATLRGTVGKRQMRLAFAGAVASSSVHRLLPNAPLPFRALRGDIALDLDLDHPRATRATGWLQGEGVDWPLPGAVPWRIERFSVAAEGSLLRIESASLEGSGNDAVLSGTVASAEDRYIVDLLLRGKSIVAPAWVSRQADAGQGSGQDSDASRALPRLLAADVPVWGSMRVELASLRVGQFAVVPLVAAGKFENGRLDLAVQRAALCGVALQARLAAQPRHARLEGGLSSRGARLEESVACLTERRVAATGGFDMDVRFSAEGPPELLLDRLQGDFQFNARDGHILAFNTLNRAFAVVNVTEVARGRLPDLSRQGMAFKSAQAKGRFDGRRLLLEDAVLDADSVTVAAQGQVDLAARTMDLYLLVAPLKTVDAVVRRVPILGRVLGGTLVAVPVHVSGTLTDPVAAPLAPQAVAARLLGILGNTLRLPVDLLDTLEAGKRAPQGAR